MNKTLLKHIKKTSAALICLAFLASCNGHGDNSAVPQEVMSEVAMSSVQTSAEDSLQSGDDEDDNTNTSAPDNSKDVGNEDNDENIITATYKGVDGYGNVTSASKDSFKYIFEIDGKKKRFSIDNGKKNADGTYTYDIQNILKRDCMYKLTVNNGKITAAAEVVVASTPSKPTFSYTPPIPCVAGKKTISNLLSTAMSPVGCTLYIYGGGWNWQDTGSSVHAESIGISPTWVEFFDSQDEYFSYITDDKKTSYYPYGMWNEYHYAGLDCSGYIGWLLYNVTNTESGNDGFVTYAVSMAKNLSNLGWGSFSKDMGNTPEESKGMIKPGDIISMKAHVWICMGTCDDGSIVIAHSTPNDSKKGYPGGGVQLSAIGNDKSCQAYELADYYMKTYFPKWYSRYDVVVKDFSSYTNFEGDEAGIFSWDTDAQNSFMQDPEGIRSMNAKQVLEHIFGEK